MSDWDSNKELIKRSFWDGAVAFPRIALKTGAWTVGIAAAVVVLVVGISVANGNVWVVGGPEGRAILDTARNVPPTLEAATPALTQADDVVAASAEMTNNLTQPARSRPSASTKADYFDCLSNSVRGALLSVPTGEDHQGRFNLPQSAQGIVEEEAIALYVATHCQEHRPPKATQSGSSCIGSNLRYWYQRGGPDWDYIAATFALNVCQPRVSFE